MNALKHGILISFEGIDGSGKSTAAKALAQYLKGKLLPVVLTKEPGATPLGQQIRTIVQEKKVPVCAESEFLLFAADRAQHFEQIVLPALAQHQIVISDRMADSSLAYQGYGRGLDLAFIERVNAFAMRSKNPDLVVYMRVPTAVAMERILQRKAALTSFEQEKKDFLERLYQGFEAIATKKKNVLTIDANKSQEEVIQHVIQAVESWFKSQKIIPS